MSLKYLDINPAPISEEGIYSKQITFSGAGSLEYKFIQEKIDAYLNNELLNSNPCETLSNGYIYALFSAFPVFYNNIIKKYVNMDNGEIDVSYSTNILISVNNENYRVEVSSVEDFPIREFVDYFSSVVYVTTESARYIGKKNNKIGLFSSSQSGNIFTEYNGTKLVNLEGKNITFLKDGKVDVYAIFKVGTNLYRYNILDDFVDDNIILWGVLPEDIENFSLGVSFNENEMIQEFYLIDFVNHNYYTATLTDTPPTPPTPTPTLYTVRFLNYDGSELEVKQVEEGTTPTYTGATPTREGYTFTGWNPDLYPADKNQDYTAEFVQNSRNVRVLIKKDNGDIISDSVEENINYPITEINIRDTNNLLIQFKESDGSYFTKSFMDTGYVPYIESYTYNEVTYNSQHTSKEPVVIETNDNSEEIVIIVNLGETYRYKIAFIDDSVSPIIEYEQKRVEEGVTPIYSGSTIPSKEGYTFEGWTPTPYPADKDETYRPVFEIIRVPHTITFEDSNDEPFTTVPSPVTYNNNLTRILFNTDLFNNPYIYYEDIDGSHTINFEYTNKDFQTRIIFNSIEINGQTYSELNTWYDVNITSNATIRLNTTVQYYIQFMQDNSTLSTLWCNKGDTPEYSGSTPTKTGYDFIGWEPEIYVANKPQIYQAKFKIKTFTIRFLDYDGSVLETQTVNYGTTPVYGGETPTRKDYIFNGWTPTLYPADKNQDYTATYRKITFAINLYQNSSENNRIDKTEYLTSVGEIEGYLRQETNIINPTIVIEYNKVIDFNYIYISTFNRYYFVNGVSSVRTNLWRIELLVDVLMTYKDTILNYECFVARNENTYDAYIEDKYLPLKYEKEIEYIEEWSSTDTNSFFKGYTAIITTIASNAGLPEEEKIEITTPFEDGNGKVAMTSTFETGSSGFKVVQFIPEQNAYGKVIDRIVQEVVGDDKVASYILSFIVFPIWNPAIYSQVQYESGTKFYYGKKSIDMTEIVDTGVTPVCVLKGDTIAPIYMRSFGVPQHYNSFLDYEPYSTYELWLPFHGWVKLNATLVVGKLLSVYYIIQPDSTKGTILVKNVTDGVVALEVPCDIGVEIAVNTTNAQEIANRKNAAAVGLGTSTAIGVAAGVLGMATLNPVLMLGGVASMLGGVSNFVQQTTDLRTEGKGSVNSGNEGLYSDRIIKLKITRTPLAVDDLTKYAKYIGRPLQTNVKLNTLTGYTIVGGVHVENLPQATESEKQEIEKILRKGFII